MTRVAGHEAAHRRTEVGPLVVEHDAHRVLVAGREVALTRREFDLLAALAEHPGWVYDRDTSCSACGATRVRMSRRASSTSTSPT